MNRQQENFSKQMIFKLSLAILLSVLIINLSIIPLAKVVDASLLDYSELQQRKVKNSEQANESVVTPWQTAFHTQITEWIQEIGQQESRFKTWLQASYETYPFGPASKQWIVLIKQEQVELGYLIIEQPADQPIFQLIEYGQSKEALFSTELQNNPFFVAENFFYHGLLWAKIEEDTLIDLITKEKYEHISWAEIKPLWMGKQVGLLSQQLHFEVNPEQEPIVFVNSLIEADMLHPLHFQAKHNYFFQAKLLPEVTGLYKVSSLHHWQGKKNSLHSQLFIGLEDEGTRYFSYLYLAQLGFFSEMK